MDDFSIKLKIMRKYFMEKVKKSLFQKYFVTEKKYISFLITNVLNNKKSHLVWLFKDHLIYNSDCY